MKDMLTRSGTIVHAPEKKLLWKVSERLFAFFDGSWCDINTGDGGNNGPGELVIIHASGIHMPILDPKSKPERRYTPTSARRHRPHAGRRHTH